MVSTLSVESSAQGGIAGELVRSRRKIFVPLAAKRPSNYHLVDSCVRSCNCDPSPGGTTIFELERQEIKEGLVAAVVGIGVDDPATTRLIQRIAVDSDALESTIRLSLGEPARLAALEGTGLMDGGPQATLDSVASLTTEALAIPYAAVSLLDGQRQFLVGSSARLTPEERWRPAELAICKYTVVSGIPFTVDDARRHPLLANLPSVVEGEVGAYAGVPLFSDDDHAVGTLHVWAKSVHWWTSGQIIILQDMADIASSKIFRRRL